MKLYLSPKVLTIFLLMLPIISCTQEKIDNTGNPFTFEKTGLPHQTSFCGVGLPDLISTDLAENIINRVFEDNGFKLTKNYLFEKNGSSFTLNGFDKQNNIGYVYLDYDNLEDDGIVPWDEYSFANFYDPDEDETAPEDERELNRLRKWTGGQRAEDIKRLINYMNKQLLVSEKKLIAEVKKSDDEKFLRNTYIKLYQKQKKFTLSVDEIKRTIDNCGKDGVYIAVISVYDESLAFYPEYGMEFEAMQADSTMEHPNTQNDALDHLKNNVKKFIEWSKKKAMKKN